VCDIVPQERLQELKIDVIRVGAVGQHVRHRRRRPAGGAATRFDRRTNLATVLPDCIEETNVETQGKSLKSDRGRPKDVATAQAVHRLESTVDVEPIADRFSPKDGMFCCVDSITAQTAILAGHGRFHF
jgi:hypothetical protein